MMESISLSEFIIIVLEGCINYMVAPSVDALILSSVYGMHRNKLH